MIDALDAMFQDNVKARRLQADGSYRRKRPAKGEEPLRAQLYLYRETQRAFERVRAVSRRQPRTVDLSASVARTGA